MTDEPLNTRSADAITDELIDILKTGTKYWCKEVYRIDLAAWFPEMHFWEGSKDDEIICPNVNNKRLWNRESAKCKVRTFYGPCSPSKVCKPKGYSCKYWGKCERRKESVVGRFRIDFCNDCDEPISKRCYESSDDGNCVKKPKQKKCDGIPCEIYGKELKRYKERDEVFAQGLHLFEIKSDADTFSRLSHQIPALVPFCDYFWLVLGEGKKVPEWVPPWMGLIIAKEDGLKIEQHAYQFGQEWDKTGVHFPNRVFKPKGLKALPELYRQLTIQTLFGWKFPELEESSEGLKKALKAFKQDYLLTNRTLDEYQ